MLFVEKPDMSAHTIRWRCDEDNGAKPDDDAGNGDSDGNDDDDDGKNHDLLLTDKLANRWMKLRWTDVLDISLSVGWLFID